MTFESMHWHFCSAAGHHFCLDMANKGLLTQEGISMKYVHQSP